MRRMLAVLALGAAVIACSEQATSPSDRTPAAIPMASVAATSDWTEQLMDAPLGDYTYYANCIDDFLDEVGPVLLRYHTVTTGGGSLLYFQVQPLDGYHLVGDKTGIWNPVLPQQGTFTERFPGSVGSYALHYTLMQGFVNEASGTRIFWPTTSKVTINPNGTLTVERGVWDVCHIAGQD